MKIIYAFQITKKIVFEVHNGQIESNPYFATSACVFNQPKTDFNCCGQCQNDVLPAGKARDFWEKWDKKHLSILTEEEEKELLQDLEVLKCSYNYCESTSFYSMKELSKLPLKKRL